MTDLRNRKSPGHICFAGDFEFFFHACDVYRAKRSNPGFDLDGRRLGGRWECTLPFLRAGDFKTITGLEPEPTS